MPKPQHVDDKSYDNVVLCFLMAFLYISICPTFRYDIMTKC